MKARGLMKRDIDYVVKDGQVIVDEFCAGRTISIESEVLSQAGTAKARGDRPTAMLNAKHRRKERRRCRRAGGVSWPVTIATNMARPRSIADIMLGGNAGT